MFHLLEFPLRHSSPRKREKMQIKADDRLDQLKKCHQMKHEQLDASIGKAHLTFHIRT